MAGISRFGTFGRIGKAGLSLFLLAGCATFPPAPSLGLQRSLFPGLDSLEESEIESALDLEVVLDAPISAGIVWLSEGHRGSAESRREPLTEYSRTGVLQEALSSLRSAPFGVVAALPTIPELSNSGPSDRTLEMLRSASAKFQYDVALLLQTGTAEERGFNPFALGYLGLVTSPLFPGNDFAAASSVELCAVDVRTGVMLGCARGRAQEMDRVNFIWQQDQVRQELAEQTLRAALTAAVEDLRGQLSVRLTEHGVGTAE